MPRILPLVAFTLLLSAAAQAPAAAFRTLITRHYHVVTDLDSDLAADCAKRLDGMYEEYARRFSAVADLRQIPTLQVFLYQKRADYLQQVGGDFQNTGGLFVPGRQFLAAFLEGQGRDALARTLQHEAFHQFVHQAFPNDLPVWLNEGMAQIFEEGLWTGNEFWIDQVPPRRVRRLRADLKSGRLLDFTTMATLSPSQWAQAFTGDTVRITAQYDQAWAMVHFLMHATDANGREIYRPRLFKLLQLIHDRADAALAFTQTFPDARQVQGAFLVYADSLEPTASATIIERQGVLADLMVALHEHQAIPARISQLQAALSRGAYRVRYAQGDVNWESDANATSYFADLTGHPFDRRQLSLQPQSGALPDIVCKCLGRFQLRTRFYPAPDGRIEHEMIIEEIPTQAAVR